MTESRLTQLSHLAEERPLTREEFAEVELEISHLLPARKRVPTGAGSVVGFFRRFWRREKEEDRG